MIVVEVHVQRWTTESVHVELPGIPALGDLVVLDDNIAGIVREVVWEPSKPAKVRIG